MRRMLLPVLLLAGSLVLPSCGENDAANTSGPAPPAPWRAIPGDLSLAVDGEVMQEQRFDSTELSALPTTCLRTREVTRDGEFLGAYTYIGIPLIHILGRVEPDKENADFDRPLDMVVTLTDAAGNQSHFSHGEISMADDALPITLAFYREPVATPEDPEYTGNKFAGNVTGLRLICPGDADVERYLDDVRTITLRTPVVRFEGLPVQQKGLSCSADSLVRCSNDGCTAADLEGVEEGAVSDWVRVGHGRGFRGISTASGYRLVSFLEKNFPGDTDSYFYLFIACDGYRSLFSGTEIFDTAAGRESLIVTELDGERPHGGLTLGPLRDYFVDRDVWGLSHIVQLKPAFE